jgi:hypothetical protein
MTNDKPGCSAEDSPLFQCPFEARAAGSWRLIPLGNGHWTFVIRDSFVIRISSFVIPPVVVCVNPTEKNDEPI